MGSDIEELKQTKELVQSIVATMQKISEENVKPLREKLDNLSARVAALERKMKDISEIINKDDQT